MHGIGRTLCASQCDRPATRHQNRFVLLPRNLVDREGDRGITQIRDRVDAVPIEPGARNRSANIGFVLVIRRNDLDAFAGDLATEVLRGHFGGNHRSAAGRIGKYPSLVVENADLDDVTRGHCRS